ncbi:MAG TPA: cytochrome c oxidase assembly protein [Alphaproteobacteria bacterium]|nr:cytochrome c oxidase assembly protein [Alphaproteobacteria bacterium]
MSAPSRRNKITAFVATGIVAGMLGMSYAAVPLYRIFCQVTGFGGTTQRAEAAPHEILDRTVTVRLNADVAPALAWKFQPVQRDVTLKVGEEALAFYRATNASSQPVVGMATFNVTPDKAGQYFNKIACFCFTEQRLEPGQSIDMPVTFFVDPRMAQDRNMDDVTDITLSYTFFPVEKPASRDTAAVPTPSTSTLN